MYRTRLSIPRMDCAAEERLVRMAFAGDERIRRVDVDLATRDVMVFHEDNGARLLDLSPSVDNVVVLSGVAAEDSVVSTGSFFLRAEAERLGLRAR